jgi:hypothetical protein
MENIKKSKSESMKLKSDNKEYNMSDESTESHLNIKLDNMVKEESFNLSEKYDIHEMAKLLNSDILDLEWKARMKKYRKHSHFGVVKVPPSIIKL